MTKILRKTFKWLGMAIVVVTAILLLAIGILAMPGPFFPAEKQYRAIAVHSEAPIGQEIDSVMAEVFQRLDAVPIYDPNRKFNLCLCSTQDKFTFFARLTHRANRIMGFSLLGSIYVNGDFLEELAVKTGGRPKYSAREGSV
jgi:multidrug efflux pump subunit AcrB